MATNLPRLTHHVAKNPPRAATELLLWAEEPKGFGLRVPASEGRDPAYIFNFRLKGGRDAPKGRITLGRTGELRFAEAKELAQTYRAAVLRGDDPRELINAGRRDGRTVTDLIEAWKRDGAHLDRRTGRRRRPETVSGDVRRLEAHIIPLIGSKRLTELSRLDIERVRDAVASGKTARVVATGKPRGRANIRGGDGTATRTIRTFSSACGWGVEQGWLQANPVKGVRLTPERKSDRFLTSLELQRLGEALTSAERAQQINLLYADLIRLLALTGARKGEIESLRWDEVDLQRGLLNKAESKTGRKAIPIGADAQALLRRLQDRRLSEWVFPAAASGTHLKDTSKAFKRVAALAGLDGVRLHDLRHTFASVGAASGVGLPVVGSVLGHKSATTTSRYAHIADDPRRLAAEAIGSVMAQHIAKTR